MSTSGSVPIVFDQRSPGRAVAVIHQDCHIKFIEWMGVVCLMDRYGSVYAIWHGPN